MLHQLNVTKAAFEELDIEWDVAYFQNADCSMTRQTCLYCLFIKIAILFLFIHHSNYKYSKSISFFHCNINIFTSKFMHIATDLYLLVPNLAK